VALMGESAVPVNCSSPGVSHEFQESAYLLSHL
jgi:hypothetical protein